jgi:hypothetical protein
MSDTEFMTAGLPTPRAAGEIQISALPEATTPISENDITNIKQGVEDKKVTVRDLLAPHASKTGNVHNMKPSDMGLGNVKDYPITDAVNDKDSQKYASAMAVALVSERLDKQTPVGHILLSTNAENPANCGYVGQWAYLGQGRTLIGFDPNNAQRPVGTQLGSDTVNIGVNNLPAHTMKLTGTVSEAGAHNHTININTSDAGTHNHTVNLSTSGAGNHAHSFNVNTGGAGAHSHGFSGNTNAAGTHNHGAPVESSWNDYAPSNVPASYWGGGRGVFWNSRSSTSTDGNHTHSFSGGTSGVGDHVHNVAGNTSAVGDHTHSISGGTGQVGNHNHNVSGATTQVGNHTHSIDLTTQSIGGGQALNVMQASLVVYIWTRIA